MSSTYIYSHFCHVFHLHLQSLLSCLPLTSTVTSVMSSTYIYSHFCHVFHLHLQSLLSCLPLTSTVTSVMSSTYIYSHFCHVFHLHLQSLLSGDMSSTYTSHVCASGKLFKTYNLPWVVEFFLMFFKDKPIDWLLDNIFYVKYCSPEHDMVRPLACSSKLTFVGTKTLR